MTICSHPDTTGSQWHVHSNLNGLKCSGLRISIRERQGPPLGPIPRIIHQTFKTRKLGERQEALISTWKQYNPNWDYRFYDDEQCHNLVAQDFPEWLDAYNALPLPVERADFFR